MEQFLINNPNSSLLFDLDKDDENLRRFSIILEGGYKRAHEAILYFDYKAGTCNKMLNKAFYMYLDVKKDAQRTIMEKIARSLGIELAPVSGSSHKETTPEITNSVDEEFGDIFKIIHEIAADELEFYLMYASVEKNVRVRSLLLMLADLAKEFLFDVKIWYLNHKDTNKRLTSGTEAMIFQDYSVETVFN
jgi:hypothetical protein